MSSLSFKFSKAAKLFEILIWYCVLTSSSLNVLRLTLSSSNSCVLCLLNANLSLNFTTNRYWSVSQSVPLKDRTSSALECHLLCINMWLIWSGEFQEFLWIFRCRNVVLLSTRFFYVAKSSILTPLSLLSWCRLTFQVVDLKISSVLSNALKSPDRVSMRYLGKW